MPYALARAAYTRLTAANITDYGYCVHVIRHRWDLRQGVGRRTGFASSVVDAGRVRSVV